MLKLYGKSTNNGATIEELANTVGEDIKNIENFQESWINYPIKMLGENNRTTTGYVSRSNGGIIGFTYAIQLSVCIYVHSLFQISLF